MNSHTAGASLSVFDADDLAQKCFISRNVVAKRKRNEQPHPDEAVGHAGGK